MTEARAPTPEPLRLVQRFVNTMDLESGTDELGGPEQLAAWLSGVGLPGAQDPLGPADVERTVAVREALRGLLRANAGHAHDPSAPAILNRVGEQATLAVRFGTGTAPQLVPSGRGVDAALARILATVQQATLDGTWPRLKACSNDRCGWAFYDRSRNRSGTWCAMAACGNVMKARAYRRRRRSAASG